MKTMSALLVATLEALSVSAASASGQTDVEDLATGFLSLVRVDQDACMRSHDGFDEEFSKMLSSRELNNLRRLFDFHQVERKLPARIKTDPSRIECFDNLRDIQGFFETNAELIDYLIDELPRRTVE